MILSTKSIDLKRKNEADLIQECLIFMANHSFPIKKIVNDGTWQRLSIDEGKDADEWYIARSGFSSRGTPWLMATFGTWAGGLQVLGSFKSWTSGELHADEKKDLQREFDEWEKAVEIKKAKEQQEKIQKARNIWESASEEPFEHERHLAYLLRKGVSRYGIRFGKRFFNEGPSQFPRWIEYPTLIIPLRNADGEIQAVQHIREDGLKRFDGPSKGGSHLIGSLNNKKTIYVCEGYATSATVFEATHCPTIVAFDCGNLDPVVATLRKKYPQHSIVIGADDDLETPGNPGRTKAQAIANKYQCRVLFPSFPSDFKLPPKKNGQLKGPSDWNDLSVHFGFQEVQRQICIEEKQKPKPKLITLTYQELIAKDIPSRKFILKPWLPEAAISMIYAPPGIGKSYLCLSAAGVIASGGRLFQNTPWEAPEPRKVLYIDGEMHEIDLQTRVKKLLYSFINNIPEDYLRYLNGSWQETFIPDLSSIEGQQLIEEVIAEQGTQVLFLDNLSTLCRCGRENETDSWKPVQSWLLQLRWRGITVVLVHHASKAKDEHGKPRQRGTSMREVILESSIVLDRPKDYEEEMGCVFELSYTKSRGFFGSDAASFEAKLIERDGFFVWEDKKLDVKNYDRIVDLYNDGTTQTKEIASEVGISQQAVRKHLRRAKQQGDIQ